MYMRACMCMCVWIHVWARKHVHFEGVCCSSSVFFLSGTFAKNIHDKSVRLCTCICMCSYACALFLFVTCLYMHMHVPHSYLQHMRACLCMHRMRLIFGDISVVNSCTIGLIPAQFCCLHKTCTDLRGYVCTCLHNFRIPQHVCAFGCDNWATVYVHVSVHT